MRCRETVVDFRKSQHLHMRIQPNLKRQVQHCAEARGMKVTTWVEQVLRDAIKAQSRG